MSDLTVIRAQCALQNAREISGTDTTRRSAGFMEKVRWNASWRMRYFLPLLNLLRARVFIWNQFDSPGDAILLATACNIIKKRYPGLRFNVETNYWDLLKHDLNLEPQSANEAYWKVCFTYSGIIDRKDGQTNVLSPFLGHFGIRDFEYRARFVLAAEECESAKKRLSIDPRPMITFNVMSREQVKVWPVARWADALARLGESYRLVQLGDETEPHFHGVERWAGNLTMRESAAVLSQASLHLGCVSLLMHLANALNVPAVIVYGGRETPMNSGYQDNVNLASAPECSPCWIHDSRGQICPHALKCMDMISVSEFCTAVKEMVVRKTFSTLVAT